MSCERAGNNATPPSPAIAPGAESIDVTAAAAEIGTRWADGGASDPRIAQVRRHVPQVDAPFFQAGLAGYSDAAMRIVARRHGCPLCVTEALLDRMLLAGGRGFDKADLAKQERLIDDNLPVGDDDQPLVGQIIGSDPDEMAAAALKMIEQAARKPKAYRDLAYGQDGSPTYVDTRWEYEAKRTTRTGETPVPRFTEKLGSEPAVSTLSCGTGVPPVSTQSTNPIPRTFAAIDVNLACPVKKIDRKARGGHWLSEPAGAIDLLRAVRDAVPPHIPCTVKLRRGYDDTPEMAANFETIFNAVYELGYAWATVHARTVEQKYIGPSRWPFLKDLCARYADRPVFGSGDVWEAADIFRMIGYTGVAGVSVARGCIGNPWIFRQAREMMDGRPPLPPTLDEQRAVLELHFRLSCAINGDQLASKLMRKFGIRFAAHHPQAEEVRQRMIAVNSMDDWLAVLDGHYPPGVAAALV